MERFARVSIIFKLRLTNNNNQLIHQNDNSPRPYLRSVHTRTFNTFVREPSVFCCGSHGHFIFNFYSLHNRCFWNPLISDGVNQRKTQHDRVYSFKNSA